jgi:hypothetical protein
MRYVIDIDGTICTNTNGKYEDAVPFYDRIQHINQLYDEGNIIVFHTARGMRTHNDDVIAAHNQWYDFTKKQLDEWNIKYHKLVLGKPQGDIYVDDKGLNDYDFFLTIYEQFK